MRTIAFRRGVLAAAIAAVCVTAAPAPAAAATEAPADVNPLVVCVSDQLARHSIATLDDLLYEAAWCVRTYVGTMTNPQRVLAFNRCLRQATAEGIEHAIAFVPDCVDTFLGTTFHTP